MSVTHSGHVSKFNKAGINIEICMHICTILRAVARCNIACMTITLNVPRVWTSVEGKAKRCSKVINKSVDAFGTIC